MEPGLFLAPFSMGEDNMPDVKCPECGGEIGFFAQEGDDPGDGSTASFYCLDTQCKLHGGIGIPKQLNALDVQVGGDWYKNLAIQPAEYCQRNNLNMLESGVVKYVTRHRNKDGEKDIRKAIHCLELLLELDYPEGTKHTTYGCDICLSPVGEGHKHGCPAFLDKETI